VKRLGSAGLILFCVACGPRNFVEELGSERPEQAQEKLLQMGAEAVPVLRQALRSRDRVVSRRALELLARITGQWGSDGGILWKRSMKQAAAEAQASRRPVLLLQIFGRLDEELC
jgi:hypothetical protein